MVQQSAHINLLTICYQCDIQRPCTLCVRTGSECVIAKNDPFKLHQPRQSRQWADTDGVGSSKRRRMSDKSSEDSHRSSNISSLKDCVHVRHDATNNSNALPSVRDSGDSDPVESTWGSSSTMTMVEKVSS
jgi:hypothetical protein